MSVVTDMAINITCKNVGARYKVSNDELNYIPVSAPKTPTPADSKWIVPLAQEIIQHVETNNIAVLNVHYAVGLVEAALEARQELASRGYSLSVCLTLHGSDLNKYGCDSNYNAQLRDCILACDCVTAVSNSLASQAMQVFSLERRPAVIHNAIDLELFHPFRKWIAAPSDTLNLCHLDFGQNSKSANNICELKKDAVFYPSYEIN